MPVTYTRSIGRVSNSAHIEVSRSRNTTTNLYAYNQDITGGLGIQGVSQNPFDWGLPGLSFTNYTGLNDIHPSLRINQTTTFNDTMLWIHGKHSWRWGGDYRWIENNNKTDSNGRGTFTFTGASTSLQNAAGPDTILQTFFSDCPRLPLFSSGPIVINFVERHPTSLFRTIGVPCRI